MKIKQRESWSSGYGRRFMYRRLWVRIPALHTGWTFSHLFGVKIVMFLCRKDGNKQKEAGNGLCSLKQVGRQTIIEATWAMNIWHYKIWAIILLPRRSSQFVPFLKKGRCRPLYVYFRYFLITISITQIVKSVDGLLGIWTWGRRMIGTDETTELWQPVWTLYTSVTRFGEFLLLGCKNEGLFLSG